MGLSDPFDTTARLGYEGTGSFGEALQLMAMQRAKERQQQQQMEREYQLKGGLAEKEAMYKQQYPTLADLFYKRQLDSMDSGGKGTGISEGLKSEFLVNNPQFKPEDIVLKKKPVSYRGTTTLVDVPEVDPKLYEQRTLREKHTQLVKDSAMEALESIKEAKAGINNFGITGWLPSMPGSERVRWESHVNKLLSGKIIDIMTKMKEASKTGATGFGQLNRDELKVLRDSSTALKRTMAPKDAKAILDKMEQKLNVISGDIARISTDEEYDALPVGADFIGPDGQRRTKK